MDYLKEVLVVEPSGEVLTNATEDDTIRHDILVGQIIQNYYDKDYQIKDSMLDNSKYACENFQDVIIMPDVTDLVALFPEGTTKHQASYYDFGTTPLVPRQPTTPQKWKRGAPR